MTTTSKIVEEFKLITGNKYVITSKWGKEPFNKGWLQNSIQLKDFFHF